MVLEGRMRPTANPRRFQKQNPFQIRQLNFVDLCGLARPFIFVAYLLSRIRVLNMSHAKEENLNTFTTKVEDAPWYAKDVGAVLQPETRQMLKEYAGIPPDQQVDRIKLTVISP
jgi:hypothetical protein